MKILGLRFANLNSLEGEWEIDFTSAEYATDGIFAITGPTGAGKSTILDALSLALYGQTPRLGKITKGSNEIMSRHAGDCFAEATFSTVHGCFRCHWSQHRARRRPGGELQLQKHEISDVVTGLPLHTKLHETLAAVEAATGMDFDRFTRSMLLAQGGFAAFLQADPDRRAPVLEQITGTEVYSRISMKVHERQREERAALDRLRSEAGNLRLLGEEVVAALRSEMGRLLEEESEAARSMERVSAALRNHQQIAALREELAGIDRERGMLRIETEAFGPEAERLRRSKSADAMEPSYAALLLQRREHARQSGEFAERERERPERVSAVERSRERCEKAEKRLRSASERERLLRPQIDQTRALDLTLAEKRLAVESVQLAIVEQERALGHLETERAALSATIERQQLEAASIGERLRLGQADAALVSELSGLRLAFESLETGRRRMETAGKAFSDASTLLESCRISETIALKEVEEARIVLAGAERALALAEEQQQALLDGKSIKELRDEHEALRKRLDLLAQLTAIFETGKGLAPRISQLLSDIEAMEGVGRETEARLLQAREQLASAEREVALLEENRLLAEKIKSYEEDRMGLAEGEPCPLCGSTSHPFASGVAPIPSGGDIRLSVARETRKQLSEVVSTLDRSLAAGSVEIGQRKLRLSELESDRDLFGKRCLALLREAEIPGPARDAEPRLVDAIQRSTGEFELIVSMIEQAESLEERLHELRQSRQRSLEACGHLDLRLAGATGRHLAASSGLQPCETALIAAQKEFGERFEELQQRLRPLGLSIEPDRDTSSILDELTSRYERRVADEAAKRNLETAIAGQSNARAGADGRISSTREELTKRRKLRELLDEELEALEIRRSELFGDRDPLAEEASLTTSLAEARQELDLSGREHAETLRASSMLEATMKTLADSIDKLERELEAITSTFLDGIRLRGFDDEQAFAAARLTEQERERLVTISLSLEQRDRDLSARLEERSLRLNQEKAMLVDTRTPDELSGCIAQMTEALRLSRERIGALRQQLAENDRLAVEHRRMAEEIERQTSECRRWESLHELIGSADGKKFRNFAQGLTFEAVVAHANRQLASMTDRYLLVRDAGEPLELNVVDNWQAGEIRSTRNLSGGESFIVSLALALGLSQMSSRNVRVDSLFLDEGFGTLDEEALETALETLAGIQQSGKLIGVISHVSALKERISTRIRVVPATGGRSTLSGPGVSHR